MNKYDSVLLFTDVIKLYMHRLSCYQYTILHSTVFLAVLVYCGVVHFHSILFLRFSQAHNLSAQLSHELREIISCAAHDMKSPCTAMQLGLNYLKKIVEHTNEETNEISKNILLYIRC